MEAAPALRVLRVAALAALIYSGPAQACNCVAYAVESLQSIQIKLRTLPAIAVNDWCKKGHPGCYMRGVMFIRSIDDCRTMIHEFVHHAQWLKHGDARDSHENWRREMQAAMQTMYAIREYGECK